MSDDYVLKASETNRLDRWTLQEKVAIVTGSGRGIGQGIAEEMAKRGAYIIVVEREQGRGSDVVSHIKNAGGKGTEIKADVTDKEDIKNLVDSVLEMHGKIDILVNNAGMSILGDFIDNKERHWDAMIGVNLKGLILLTRAVLAHMVKLERGKIINIASSVGLHAMAQQAVYSATKGGVVAFTRSLAAEVARYHINVNAICPGLIMTPGVEAYSKADEVIGLYFKKIEEAIPWGRPGQPRDIGNLASFLASDESEYITGQCIVIDGGATGI